MQTYTAVALKSYSSTHSNTTKDLIWLIGYTNSSNHTTILSGVKGSLNSDNDIDIPKDEQFIQSTIPGGLRVVGAYIFDVSPGRKGDGHEEINNILKRIKNADVINSSQFTIAGMPLQIRQCTHMHLNRYQYATRCIKC